MIFQSTNIPMSKNILNTILQSFYTATKHEWKTYVPSEESKNKSIIIPISPVYKRDNNDDDDDCLEPLELYQNCIKRVCNTNNSYFDECDEVFKMYLKCCKSK